MARSSQSSPDLAVQAVGLTKVFSDFWMRAKAVAVDGIDFDIRQHEIFGLLGPNGSGKSTTIKMILGLLRPTHGRLTVLGHAPDDVKVKSRIGYLPEESYLYRFLNPMETLDYYGKLFGLERRTRRRRCEELLEMVGLNQVGRRRVGEFSKGMARRLGLAQALVNDPDFLILDEPTSGLDPIGTRQVKDLLLELGRRGKTILLSSHLLADVEDVCDRMAVLYGGKIRASGSGDELLEDTDHTVIQTQRLRPETLSKIERLLQDAEGAGIENTHAPRQKLEDLFMKIVAQAKAEQVSNSGALHGGKTAAFLSADASEGGELVEQLASEPAPAPARVVPAAKPRETAPASELLAELAKEGSAPADKPRMPPPAKPAKDVDRSMLEGLLGDDPKSGGSPSP
ncbi:MAG: ATP-binding cassette domain-containing protein [Planctomycetes bacterium]|nr:ATP-binding cassette domain-containing protein [Planctomycetota bacterium]